MAAKQQEVSKAERQAEAKETLKTVKEISDLLNTGLDSESLNICVQLLEAGVNPEALASVVRTIRQECAAVKRSEDTGR